MVDVSKLNDKMFGLIEKEFGFSKDDVAKMGKEKWHDMRLKCFDIECAEIDEDGECSDYGEIAADIVSLKYKDVKVRE